MRYRLTAMVTAASVALIACSSSDEPSPSGPPDDGHEAFVKRVLPLMWGRKPSSIREVDVLVQLIEQTSRAEIVYRMSRSPEFVDRWSIFMRDHLGVFRLGDQSNAECYGQGLLPDDGGALAAHIRDTPPTGAAYPAPFTMVDVARSALWLDDVSPVFEAHLFAWLKQDYALPDPGAAHAAREAKSQVFLHRWLGRRMDCLSCHNSEFSVTDSPDPALDRAWPVAGHFERGALGTSTGMGLGQLRPFFRRFRVVAGAYYDGDGPSTEEELQAELDAAEAPWGIDEVCGRFLPRSQMMDDDLGETGRLGGVTSDSASIWDLENLMRTGFDRLRGGTNPGAISNDVAGPDALAWMTAQHFVDSVWSEVFGHRLTISTWFPRTREQRDTLSGLTDYFVTNRYSVGALLATITTGDFFNRPTPAATPPDQLVFADIFDPWSNETISAAERRNHTGDLVHRLPSRVLLGSVYHALGWHPPKEFPETFLSDDAVIQRQVGVYLKDGDSGFGGVSFQAQLAWEDVFGACLDTGPCPIIASGERGELTEDDLCTVCAEFDTLCSMDDRCCDLELDDDVCPPGCLGGSAPDADLDALLQGPADALWLARMVAEAQAQAAGGANLTLRDVLGALKDRILSDPNLNVPDEVAVIEALVGASLDTPVQAGDLTLDARVRRVCGVWLASPDFQLWGWPGPNSLGSQPRFIAPDTEFDTLCNAVAVPLFGDGAVQCANGRATLR